MSDELQQAIIDEYWRTAKFMDLDIDNVWPKNGTFEHRGEIRQMPKIYNLDEVAYWVTHSLNKLREPK